ncbi:hypothetical protein N665_0532s0041 [Sinapis alba]|nr:hypothetical protein N665_0532s0041 [Sinapis alba]
MPSPPKKKKLSVSVDPLPPVGLGPPSSVATVSDALISASAVEVTQQSGDSSDPLSSAPPLSPSNKPVIAVSDADPTSVHGDSLPAQAVSSLVAPSLMASVAVKADSPTHRVKADDAFPPPLAIADAKINSLSSQLAIEKVIAPNPSSAEKTSCVFGFVDRVMQEIMVADNLVEGSNLQDGTFNKMVPNAVGRTVAGAIANSTQQGPIGKKTVSSVPEVAIPANTWCDHARGLGKRLSQKGEAFTLPSGEACIQIPNSVIEKNRKSWEPFVLGQFYSDPPSQGMLHNIVNGIWSKQYRDIVVSKMEGFAFLFRIPNVATRNRVINQWLWQIEGQTMFVDKWEPGVIPTKPELTSAPILLELRKVPFQFFSEDGLERIAGLVGQSKYLHSTTANKTNLEVAKVLTVIDPRKPLPEAVNVQFESGLISRVLVSSPWMPPVCTFCKDIGHCTKRCPSLPKECSFFKLSSHLLANCPNKPRQELGSRKTRRGRSKEKQKWVATVPANTEGLSNSVAPQPPLVSVQPTVLQAVPLDQSNLGMVKDQATGESSGTPSYLRSALPRSNSGITRSSNSDIQPDSSDMDSSESDLEEGEFSKHEPDFELVRNRKKSSGQKGFRGRAPKIC